MDANTSLLSVLKSYFNVFFFGYYPYLVLCVFFLGCIARYEYAQYEWKSSSSQLLRSSGMRIGSNFFHVGIIFLLLGHFFGLLTPSAVYGLVISPHMKQKLAMFSGGFFGIICFIGLTFLLYRRLFDKRIRITSTFSDIFVLIILYIQLILGLLSIFLSAQDVSGESMQRLALWVQHVVTFRESTHSLILHEHWLFKLHIICGLTIFLIFPFTRLVHILSIPIGYLFRTGYQIVRCRS